MKRLLLLVIPMLLITGVQAESPQPDEGDPADIIAKVGDQPITYAQLNTRLNSSAVVGLSIPVLGSADRKTVMLALMDKAISAELLYLDAVKQGADLDPAYRKELEAFSDAMLGELYRRDYLVGEIEVTEAEIDAYINQTFSAETEKSERLRLSIDAALRKQKFIQREAQNRERLREGIEVLINPIRLDPDDDAMRESDTVVAEFGDRHLTWGEVKRRLSTLNNSVDVEHRVAVLQDTIDQRLMAKKGREAGLEGDVGYQKRLGEFRKTRLLNLHRSNLVKRFEPSEETLRTFYLENRDRIAINERRRIQMLVLPSRAEAEVVKASIETSVMTFYEAVLEHSIAPNAIQNLGDFGWVTRGSGFPALDDLTFSLELDKMGGPVESPAGWHLVKVVDLREANFTSFEEAATREAARRLYMRETLNDYVVRLRREEFPVVVYENNLSRLFNNEVKWIAAKSKEMESSPERASMILKEMQSWVE